MISPNISPGWSIGASGNQERADGSSTAQQQTHLSKWPKAALGVPSNQRLARRLTTIAEPIDVRRQHWFRLQLHILTLECRFGPVVMRRWTSEGHEICEDLPISEAYSMSLMLLQETHSNPRKLWMAWYSLYNLRGPSGLSVRFTLRCPDMLAPRNPYQDAIRIGDMAYIKHALASKETSISAVTVRGDSLLHVRNPFNGTRCVY